MKRLNCQTMDKQATDPRVKHKNSLSNMGIGHTSFVPFESARLYRRGGSSKVLTLRHSTHVAANDINLLLKKSKHLPLLTLSS